MFSLGDQLSSKRGCLPSLVTCEGCHPLFLSEECCRHGGFDRGITKGGNHLGRGMVGVGVIIDHSLATELAIEPPLTTSITPSFPVRSLC